MEYDSDYNLFIANRSPVSYSTWDGGKSVSQSFVLKNKRPAKNGLFRFYLFLSYSIKCKWNVFLQSCILVITKNSRVISQKIPSASLIRPFLLDCNGRLYFRRNECLILGPGRGLVFMRVERGASDLSHPTLCYSDTSPITVETPPPKVSSCPPPLLEGGCSLANVVESDKINCSDVLLQVRLLKIRNWQFSDRVFFTSQFIKPLTVLKSSSYRTLTGGASPCTHTAIGSTPGSLKWIKSRKRYKISKKFLSVGQSTRNGRVHWKENHFQTSQWKSRPRTLL